MTMQCSGSGSIAPAVCWLTAAGTCLRRTVGCMLAGAGQDPAADADDEAAVERVGYLIVVEQVRPADVDCDFDRIGVRVGLLHAGLRMVLSANAGAGMREWIESEQAVAMLVCRFRAGFATMHACKHCFEMQSVCVCECRRRLIRRVWIDCATADTLLFSVGWLNEMEAVRRGSCGIHPCGCDESVRCARPWREMFALGAFGKDSVGGWVCCCLGEP